MTLMTSVRCTLIGASLIAGTVALMGCDSPSEDTTTKTTTTTEHSSTATPDGGTTTSMKTTTKTDEVSQ